VCGRPSGPIPARHAREWLFNEVEGALLISQCRSTGRGTLLLALKVPGRVPRLPRPLVRE